MALMPGDSLFPLNSDKHTDKSGIWVAALMG